MSDTAVIAPAAGMVAFSRAGKVYRIVADAADTAARQASEIRIEDFNRRITAARDGSYDLDDVSEGR